MKASRFHSLRKAFLRGARAATIGAGLSIAVLATPGAAFASDEILHYSGIFTIGHTATTTASLYNQYTANQPVGIYQILPAHLSGPVSWFKFHASDATYACILRNETTQAWWADNYPTSASGVVTCDFTPHSISFSATSTYSVSLYHAGNPSSPTVTVYGSLNLFSDYTGFDIATSSVWVNGGHQSSAILTNYVTFPAQGSFESSDGIAGLTFINPDSQSNPLFFSAFKNFVVNFTATATNTSRVFAVGYGDSTTTFQFFDSVSWSGGAGSQIGNFQVNIPRLSSIYSSTTKQWYAFAAVYDGNDTEFFQPIAQTDVIAFRTTGSIAEYQAYLEQLARSATSTESNGFNCGALDWGCFLKDAFYTAFGISPQTVSRWQSFSLRNYSPFGYVYDLPILWEVTTASENVQAPLTMNLSGLYSEIDTISASYALSVPTKVASSSLTVFNACAVRSLPDDPYASVLNLWRLALWIGFAVELWVIAHSRIF